MTTLDDAIREHLELKRKHGADESELQELEDSAFGPPERPGEDAESGAATTVMATDAPPAEAVQPPEPPEALVEESPEVPQPPAAVAEEELTGTEQARQEYPQLDDTAAHEPIAPPPPVQSTEERDALEISLFESEEDDEEDFDIGEIDLDLGSEESTPEPEAAPEPELEELLEDTAREHVLIEPDDEPKALTESEDSADPTPMVDPDASEDDAGEASGPLVDPDPTDEGHDVLEATPEFLRDAPESDEMWFEQDKPKDFDFDD